MRDELRAWVAATSGGSAVADATPIGHGSSRRIWRVELADGRSLAVREDTGDGPVAGTPLDLAREAAVYRALASTGLPVPRLHGVDPEGTTLLLDLAPGRAEGCAGAAVDFGRWLGRLHSLDVGGLELGPLTVPADGPAHALDDLALWRSIAETRSGAFATPIVAPALAWLAERAPARASGTALCHGDAGPGNFLHDGRKVTALLDWEFAHVGDPHDDLAWVAVRNQVQGSPLDLANTFAAWRGETGRRTDRDLLGYYRVFVLVRMLVSCDATLCWSAGVEGEGNRAQVLLRPYLGHVIGEAVRATGSVSLDAFRPDARAAWEASPLHRRVGTSLDLTDLGACS